MGFQDIIAIYEELGLLKFYTPSDSEDAEKIGRFKVVCNECFNG